LNPKKLSRLPPEKAARVLVRDHLGLEGDPAKADEAVAALVPLIEAMRKLGGTTAEWNAAFDDAEKLVPPPEGLAQR
jgi:hypothetical protein